MSDSLVSSQSWKGLADGDRQACGHLSVHELAVRDSEELLFSSVPWTARAGWSVWPSYVVLCQETGFFPPQPERPQNLGLALTQQLHKKWNQLHRTAGKPQNEANHSPSAPQV